MTYNLLIFGKKGGGGIFLSMKNGWTYGKKIVWNTKMNWILVMGFCLLALIPFQSVNAETEYFPGLRRPPNYGSIPSDESYLLNLQSKVDDNYLIAQLSNYIEEQARRRFNAKMQQNQNLAIPDESSQEFTYDFPINNIPIRENDPITFAVSPDDPRYYKSTPKQTVKTESVEDEYGEIPTNNEIDVKTSLNDDAYLKLKAPMNVNPKLADYPGSSLSRDVLSRHDLNGMIEKLQNRHNEFGIHKGISHKDVIQKPIEQHGAMGMYIVALVAGISAAVTVGLIGLGIAWFTLNKKAKAAADVEYPAYGVTGPNKDISPNGDRRLAQSAQMYHYQHQKQQIIAMENRSNGDRNGSLSDVESDDENEEGDYTVYECPGLAPTGEMEVKNPLFLDDPTPATPATQQSQQNRNEQPSTSTTTTTTANINEKSEKKK